MSKYARVEDGIVLETAVAPDGIAIGTMFHADIASTFMACPDEVEQNWTFNGTSFYAPVGPDLDDVKAAQILALTDACAAAIVGGYSSSALGTAHTYPSGLTDQINMMGSVTASLLPDLATGWATPFWCEDTTGAWGYAMHTAAQIQQAGADGKAHVVTCQTTLATLSAEVAAAKNAPAVAAIVWPIS